MSPIQTYLAKLQANLDTGKAKELTHRAALQNLLEALLPDYQVIHEATRIACGAPDFEIVKGQEPIGHIEAKDIGEDLNKLEKSDQLKRYRESLTNLIFTDYLEFRWFTDGEPRTELTVKLAEFDKNSNKLIPIEGADLTQLIDLFSTSRVATLRDSEQLAHKMAKIARLICHVIYEAHQQEQKEKKKGRLQLQLETFREVLLDKLTASEFADMYAQTICYGLFAAKCSADPNQPFNRMTAGFFVPKTNPFLRNLFNQIVGFELDNRLVWAVEHLIAVLNRVDIAAILDDFGKRTGRNDPVVHFYETFLREYDPALREVRGVYYTPESVVSYIVRSLDLVLKQQFKLKDGLADNTLLPSGVHKVHILDPATGTGTFLHAVVANIFERFAKVKGAWSSYVSEHLLPRVHGFELLMAPYTVAHMKLGLLLQEYGYDFQSEERLRLFLTNTLDEPHGNQKTLMAQWLTDEAAAANEVKQDAPVMVVLGNPPYSGHSANFGEWITQLLKGVLGGDSEDEEIANYFQVDGKPLGERNPKWLHDDYVKFIRFAHWRIVKTGYGVLGFITNHGYLDNPTFRGMRQALMHDFNEIYVLDLHGNSKKKERTPEGTPDINVFDIQQGVSIGIFIKHSKEYKRPAKVFHADLWGTRSAKDDYLNANDIKTTAWAELKPTAPFYMFVPQDLDLQQEYQAGWKITEMMPINSVGIVTARDKLTIQDSPDAVMNIVSKFSELETEKARSQFNLGEDARDWKVELAQKDIIESETNKKLVQPILYRPFDKKYTYYTGNSRGFICMPRPDVMRHMLKGDNLGLITSRQQSQQGEWSLIGISNKLIECCAISNKTKEINYLFPLYIYPAKEKGLFSVFQSEDDLQRKPNFNPDFITNIERNLKLEFVNEGRGDLSSTVSAEDVFYYMYAVFHSRTYRERYAGFLKIDFPRLPLTSNRELFSQLVALGAELANIHLMEASLDYENGYPIEGDNLVDKVTYKDDSVFINATQYFDAVSPDVWAFHIGGYQVCQKWLKDRKGRALNFNDINHYLYILAAIKRTIALMNAIDEVLIFPIE
jgi:predicted helicase